MRILYVALKYDYGRRVQGFSFEHYNFYDSLVRMGHDIIYFDIGTILAQRGKEEANKLLIETVKQERPDALFNVPFKDELEEHCIREASENTDTVTIAWFSDDHWRFDSYSRFRARWFNWSITTSDAALLKYRALGIQNVLKSQWACNTFLYKPMNLPKRFGVAFVGLPHGDRRFTMQALADAGVEVHTFGKGWDAGRVTQEEMIKIFNVSHINLNLANASTASSRARRALTLALHGVSISPLPRRARTLSVRGLSVLDRALSNGRSKPTYPEQLKGRNFEVPGCDSFLLTTATDNLDEYYAVGKEVAAYRGTSDLIAQVKRFLAEPELRSAIASAGYQRTLREHTYPHRFAEVFETAGLASPAVEPILAGHIPAGRTIEVS
jgi:spore maturation protein CgeB